MKHLEYLSYVIRHKWWVFLECKKLGIPIQGITHDLSKFHPAEWFPYVEYFYGDRKRAKSAFKKAWLHHIHHNPHHWEYWIIAEKDTVTMPTKYIKEMLADWRGTGKAQGNDSIRDWYEKNRERITMNLVSRAILHNFMKEDELGL